MKRSLLLMLCLLCAYSLYASRQTFEKLCAVNAQWALRPDAQPESLPACPQLNAYGWIALHLELVEQKLRAVPTARLSAQQQANRLRRLDELRAYRLSGAFPINEQLPFRNPVFIDNYDNFCAVGQLLKTSGHEAIARHIASVGNLAYVPDMQFPELDAWALENGFTKDELAWIQPGYPPVYYGAPMGRGTNGTVHELFADTVSDALYVGGDFTIVDSTIASGGIARLTEQNGQYTWHSMGGGFDGPVYAITRFNNKIYAAGSFSQAGQTAVNNIAYWDGNAWQPAGCLYGTVYDLMVFRDTLFAAGSFDVCAALPDVNFAWWDGSIWRQHYGLSGRVNTMEATDSSMILGGAFSYQNQPLNIMEWSPEAGFQPYQNGIQNEVHDLQLFRDTLYAACSQSGPGDARILYQLNGNSWDTVSFQPNPIFSQFQARKKLAIYTLCTSANGNLVLGGDFTYVPLVGIPAFFTMELSPLLIGSYEKSFHLDDQVHIITLFHNNLITGGVFKEGTAGLTPIMLNGICVRKPLYPQSVPTIAGRQQLKLFPNPAGSGSLIRLEAQVPAAGIRIVDQAGRRVLQLHELSLPADIQLPQLAPGVYQVLIHSRQQGSTSVKLLIQ